MIIDHLNIEPNRVLDTPDIIYLKEYPIIRSTIITPTIQRKFITQIFKDERVSLKSLYGAFINFSPSAFINRKNKVG